MYDPVSYHTMTVPPSIQGLPNNNEWLNTYNMLLANVPTNSGESATIAIAVLLIGLCLCCFCILAAEVGGVLYTKYYGDQTSSLYKMLFTSETDTSTDASSE